VSSTEENGLNGHCSKLSGSPSKDVSEVIVPKDAESARGWRKMVASWGDQDKSTGIFGRILAFCEVHNLKLECLCGVTVALAQVPEAVAFSFVAGLSPAIGVNSAWIIGIVTAIFGGRPAMVCGATGALAVVVPTLVENEGEEYLFYAVMLMGCIQMVLGALGIGKVIKMIPAPVMIGFCNGLALVIGLAQFNTYKVAKEENESRRLGGGLSVFTDGAKWIDGEELILSVSITILAFLVCILMPRLTKKIPSALTAIFICTLLEWVVIRQLGSKTATVLDASGGGVGGSFPKPVWFNSEYKMPELSMDAIKKVYNLSIVLAAIGLLESLMTLNLIDDITQTRGSPTRECIAQGAANFICGALGGMGGCAMIGQSMINIGSGARNRISSTCAGVFLLLIILVAYPAIDCIPVSALAGVMFNVVYHTFEWSSLKLIGVACLPYSLRSQLLPEASMTTKIRRADAFVIVLVTVVTIFSDLAVAVGVGTILSCCIFAWEAAETITVTCVQEIKSDDGVMMAKVYDVDGTLFFGSTKKFLSLFDANSDPAKIYVTFHAGMIGDYSAIESLNSLAERYAAQGKTVVLRKLKPGCLKMLRKARALVSPELELQFEVEEELPKDHAHHFSIESFKQGEPGKWFGDENCSNRNGCGTYNDTYNGGDDDMNAGSGPRQRNIAIDSCCSYASKIVL